jgi:uncharacterized OsmC-like protein
VEAIIRHIGKVKFEVEARQHRIQCDQPFENSGDDSAMTPPELMLASLGTCAGFYAAEYMRTRSISTQGLTVRVSAEKTLKPARLASFRIEVKAPAAAEEHREGLLRAVKVCLIHNTLMHAPAVETVVETGCH